MTFGPILRQLRKMAGLTQDDMAEKLHMSRPNISKIERDQVELRLVDAIQWCQATNMPEVAAAMLTGIDPSIVMQIVDNLQAFLHTIGAALVQSLLTFYF